jgi:alpha-beta hydrolase superfamily lysophospholipase
MTQASTGTVQEATFESVGGLNIFFRSWHPAGTPRGVVVIVPGFNSHSGYYAGERTKTSLAIRTSWPR